jgi:hypothetical protein
MAISLIDYTVANSDGSSLDKDIRFAKPTGQDGDMFVVVIGSTNQGSISRSGWTTVQSPDKGSPDRQIRMMMKVITNYAAESSSIDFRNTDSVLMQGVLMCLRGADITTPTFVRQGQGDDEPVNANSQTPSVTTTFDEAFILACTAIVDTSGRPGSDPFGSVSGTPTATIILDGVPAGSGEAQIPENGNDHYYVKTGVAYAQQTVAGVAGGYGFYVPNVPGSPDELRDGAEIAMAVAIKPATGGNGGSCTCNAICDNDCGANQICTGHVPVCSNDFSFYWTPVAGTTIILADHLRQLEEAIQTERLDTGRRYTASEPAYCSTHTPGNLACTNNAFAGYPFGGGVVEDPILASHWDDVKDANNEVVSNSGWGYAITANFIADGIIYAVDVLELQTRINLTRDVCICDSHCNCDPSDCGCNAECPSDDYSYYYYP